MAKTFLLPLVLVLLSCSSSRNISVEVLKPAVISIDPAVTSVTLVNRSIATERSNDRLLTLETKNQDTRLSEDCMRGMNEFLGGSSRFAVKRSAGNLNAGDPQGLRFGELLTWEIVDSICKEYGTTGILVLEYFDTDISLGSAVQSTMNAAQSVINGNTNPTVTGIATARAGFRLYDNVHKTVGCQEEFVWRSQFTESASNILINGKPTAYNSALQNTSYETGREFASTIIPLYFWENRIIYRKPKSSLLSKGYRYAVTSGWQEALKAFEEEYNTAGKSKTRARAAHNAALCHEVLGNLESALDWIQKSYVERPSSATLEYSNRIQGRINEQNRLQNPQ